MKQASILMLTKAKIWGRSKRMEPYHGICFFLIFNKCKQKSQLKDHEKLPKRESEIS